MAGIILSKDQEHECAQFVESIAGLGLWNRVHLDLLADRTIDLPIPNHGNLI